MSIFAKLKTKLRRYGKVVMCRIWLNPALWVLYTSVFKADRKSFWYIVADCKSATTDIFTHNTANSNMLY